MLKDLYAIIVTLILLGVITISILPEPLVLTIQDEEEILEIDIGFNRVDIQILQETRVNMSLNINNKIFLDISIEYTWINLPSSNYNISYEIDPDYDVRLFWEREDKVWSHLNFADAVFVGPWGNENDTLMEIYSPCASHFTWYDRDLNELSDVYISYGKDLTVFSEPVWLLAYGSQCFWTVRTEPYPNI